MDLSYEIRRSARRKNITITVERDRTVVVHAPTGVTEDRIRKQVDSKRQWLFEKLNDAQKYQALPHAPGKELVNGESALYLGRAYRIEIVDADAAGVRFAGKFFIPNSLASKRKQVLRQWYVERANERILPRVALHARNLGVNFAQTRIVDSRLRWGSCTPTNNLNFNWRLIKAPVFAIDYVIVHELAHLLESNHTPRFWNIVRTQLPAMQRARNWLREYGQSLEDEV